MRIIHTKALKYHELSDGAKERAREWWRSCDDGQSWSEEWRESLKTYLDYWGVPASHIHWEVDHGFGTSWWVADGGEYFEEQWYDGVGFDRTLPTGVRLRTYLLNNHAEILSDDYCPTGYCGDYSLFQPLRDFIASPTPGVSLPELVIAGVQQWATDWGKDIEYQHSDECVADAIIANDYEFTEAGECIC